MSRNVSLRHEVALLVIAGTALGIAYNAMGLASRPSRGIPWVAAKTALVSLEDLAPADSGAVEPGGTTLSSETTSPTTPAPAGSTLPTVGGAAHSVQPTGATSSPTAGGTSPRTGGAAVTPAGGAAPPRTGGPAAIPPGGAAVTPPGASSATPPGSRAPATSPGASPSAALPDARRTAPLPFIPDSDQPIQLQVATVKRFFDARAALFLDARDPAEYEKGHIPGAIRLTNPEAQNEPQRVKALPVEGRPTIVYCEGGACEASLELARFLLESGFKKVLVYMGGYPEWEAAGHPVERGSGR